MTGRGEAIGIALSATAISAVHLQRGRLTAAHEVPITPDQLLPAAFVELVALLALKTRWRPLPVLVALGPTHMQLRRLTHLPKLSTRRVLSTIVHENPDRFFLRSGAAQLTTPVTPLLDGALWAATIERALVLELREHALAGHMRVIGVVPVAAVLGSAIGHDVIHWHDGPCVLHAEYANQRLQRCRVLPESVAGAGVSPTVFATLIAEMGDGAERYAAAYGAAVVPRKTPLVLLTRGEVGDEGEGSMLRSRLAFGACLAGFLFALAAPGLSATQTEKQARERLVKLAPARERIARAERELVQVTGVISELTAFERSASSVTFRLASLTEAITAPTMLVSLNSDSAGGTLVAITPHADELIEMLEEAPGIADARIVGAVMPEPRNVVPLHAAGVPQTPIPMPPGPPGALSQGGYPHAPPPIPNAIASAESVMERLTVRFSWKNVRAPSTITPSPSARP